MRTVFILIILFISEQLFSQKHDYVWLFGYDNLVADTVAVAGGAKADFNFNTVNITKSPKLADFDACDVSFCDNEGNLLFYSNCADIFDKRDSVMLGGDSINAGVYWNYWVSAFHYRYTGLPIDKGILALPYPGDSTKAALCHYNLRFVGVAGGDIVVCDTTFFSLVDLKGNNNLGEVVIKDRVITSDTLTTSLLSSTQHGNGRDWWIIHPYYDGNCYYEFFLNDSGLSLFNIQCLGRNTTGLGDLGSSCFSPDGQKYFWVTASDGIHMFDFDRCTGQLSNPVIIPFPFPYDSATLIAGLAVSPNNRFLYITCQTFVLQYDLQAPNIGAAVDTVAFWAGFSDYGLATNFYLAQLAPDGKIYIGTGNTTRYLHVINRPDEAGDSCLFVQHSVYLGVYNEFSIPNFPNYRLGAWPRSPCDTLSTATQEVRAAKEKVIKIFPNPATDYTIVDYGFTDWNKGEVSLEIRNELGQKVYEQKLPIYSGYQRINLSRFAMGLYNVAIIRNNGIVGVGKFVKE